jgi:hypothetical protein
MRDRQPRPWLVSLVCLAALLAVPISLASEARVSATATIAGSGTEYRLTVVNDGDEPILCFGLLLEGVQPVNATGPAGVLTRVGTFQGRGLVHMQGTPAVPAIPAGATVTVTFRTNVAIPANAGGEIRYSATCQPGSDQIGRASGPTPPPPPPPPPTPQPTPCTCKDLKARIVPNRLLAPQATATGMTLELLVEWTLTCTKGTGNCNGRLTLVPSARGKRLGARVSAPAGAVTCQGPCARRTTQAQKYVVTAGPRYASGRLGRSGERLLRLELQRVCKGKRLNQVFYIAFTRAGAVDRGLSDLNGNGIDDRKD